METTNFVIPNELGLNRSIDRAMHAICAVDMTDTSEEAQASLLVAAQRWSEVARRMREIADSMPRK